MNESELFGPGSAILLADIQDTKQMLTDMNLDKHIPVGNSDAGSFFATEVLEAVEYGVSGAERRNILIVSYLP